MIPFFGGVGFGIGIPTDELELELLELGPLLEPAPLLELVPHLELVPLPEFWFHKRWQVYAKSICKEMSTSLLLTWIQMTKHNIKLALLSYLNII